MKVSHILSMHGSSNRTINPGKQVDCDSPDMMMRIGLDTLTE